MPRTLLFLGCALCLSLGGCSRSNMQSESEQLEKQFASDVERSTTVMRAWAATLDSVRSLSVADPQGAIAWIDRQLAAGNTSPGTDRFHGVDTKTSDLRELKGDLYVQTDSLEKAVSEYALSRTGKLKRVSVCLKLKQFSVAKNDLVSLSILNHDNMWYLGNYYEIIHKKDSALLVYERLYAYDTAAYKHCLDRIEALKERKPVLLVELAYTNRDKAIMAAK